MRSGILVLTSTGRKALQQLPPDLSATCRNILVQIDGKRSSDDIHAVLKGLAGLDEAIDRLAKGGYIEVSLDCRNIVRNLLEQTLGTKAPTLIKKLDEMHTKYGDQCWEHLDELDKVARMFYGEVVAQNLKTDISRIIQGTRK